MYNTNLSQSQRDQLLQEALTNTFYNDNNNGTQNMQQNAYNSTQQRPTANTANTTQQNSNKTQSNVNVDVKIVIDCAKFEYVHIAEPWAYKEGEILKYSITLLIPKPNAQYNHEDFVYYNNIVQKIKSTISEAYNKALTGVWDTNTPNPNYQALEKQIIRDGDQSGKEIYYGCYYIKATRNINQGLVLVKNANGKFVQDGELLKQIQNGDWGAVYLTFKGYQYTMNNKINKGIGIYLDAIYKTHDGNGNSNNTFNPNNYK